MYVCDFLARIDKQTKVIDLPHKCMSPVFVWCFLVQSDGAY